jgi:MoaA/NifB/PqqE/SkfB family radical SAM enzyme
MHWTDTGRKALLSTALTALAYTGPALARVKPFWRAGVRAAERQIYRHLAQTRTSRERPPGVCDDRAVMYVALLHSFERALIERRLAPAVVRRALRNLGLRIILERGDRSAADAFKEQYGTHPPAMLLISPGKACNLRCTGCYADSGSASEKLDWHTFDRVIAESKTLWGARFVAISGGEPFAYRAQGRGLLDAAEKHDDCFFLVYSNGTLIDDRVAERLAELGNVTPAISVEGWRERTDARRGPGVFDQVVAAMGRLRDAGVPFGISLTATCENAQEILSDEFIDFFYEEQGALYGWLFHYMPIGRSYTLGLLPTPEQRLWMWRRSWQLIRERQIVLADFWNHGTVTDGCISSGRFSGGGYLNINWNGAVTPCVFVPYSPVNINEIYARGGTLNDAWADAFFDHLRSWQRAYRRGNGHAGNWMAPCPIRDHHAAFRRVLIEHEPDPTDANATEALLDPEYARGMIAYGEACQSLDEEIWEGHYLRPGDPGNGHVAPLPRVPEPEVGAPS